jgi:predicted DCC family thiol-disulfide oxidoreductase YuxK
LLPRWLLDIGYDGVARIRKHLFAPPPGACPILPAELRGRFLE